MPEGFFDFHEKLGRKKAAAARPSPAQGATLNPKDTPLSVTELTRQIEKALKAGLPSSVLVKGEVSNLNIHRSSGHLYFTLKDELACIDCVMFKSDAARLKFTPDDGMEIIAAGRVAIYPQRGRYQLYVTRLDPLGRGALELAFRQLCAKLEAEGLFAPERKKHLPRYPTRIALVTSLQTAALQDMLKVLRRFPWITLGVYHVPVQGDGAAEKIADAINQLNRGAAGSVSFDLLILARGGGSLEDLWEFNEEVVARAVAASKIPVVTGIGHEVDVSVADLVADYHAHTPTEAAQVVTAHWKTVKETIDLSGVRMRQALRGALQDVRRRLISIERSEVFRRPQDRINALRQLLDDRQKSLVMALGWHAVNARDRLTRASVRLRECHPRHAVQLNGQHIATLRLRLDRAAAEAGRRRATQVENLARQLEAVSPQRVLGRGYTITLHKRTGQIVRSAAQVKPGDRLVTRLPDGQIESTAQDTRQLPLFDE